MDPYSQQQQQQQQQQGQHYTQAGGPLQLQASPSGGFAPMAAHPSAQQLRSLESGHSYSEGVADISHADGSVHGQVSALCRLALFSLGVSSPLDGQFTGSSK